MAKLYFRYGTVGSAKTLNLLAVAHNYERQGREVLVLKPAFDERFGARDVVSRAGLSRPADHCLAPGDRPDPAWASGVACVLVDEAQFLEAAQVDALHALTLDPGVPVICYGLRSDFRTRLFPGSRRLMEVADSIEEIKTTCTDCTRKATHNVRVVDGIATLEGAQQELGAEERFLPVCHAHYEARVRSGSEGRGG